MLDSVAVYVHTPFCPSKCGYCDFNSYVMSGDIVERTCDAIAAEISASSWRGIPAKTIFFGGGTPTFLPVDLLVKLLRTVLEVHPKSPLSCGFAPKRREGGQTGGEWVKGRSPEITSEANPGTVDAEKFAAMREAGFNRISLGAQSFFEDDLHTLGRIHTAGEIERAVDAARSAGFDNVNIDLMFALPNQSLKAWRYNLERAIALGTDHLSLYGLTLEPNTPFYKLHRKGQLTQPEEELQVRMYDLAVDLADRAGLKQYEISNFAKPGHECEHNLCYWRNEYYAGYGPGAVGFMPNEHDAPRRYTNLKHPERYCSAIDSNQPVWFEEELLKPEDVRLEKLMLGLRLNEGLAVEGLDARSLAEVEGKGWIEVAAGVVRLTPQGRHFCSDATLALA